MAFSLTDAVRPADAAAESLRCPSSASGYCDRGCVGDWCERAVTPKPQTGGCGEGVPPAPQPKQSSKSSDEERLEAEVAAVAKSLSELLGLPVLPVKFSL